MIEVETMFHYSDGDCVFADGTALSGGSGMEVDGSVKNDIVDRSND
ncbi:hypothetical protein [Kluyvera chengduensis]